MGHNFISGVYGPMSMKFGMKVGLWTLITGKILWSSYLGNGCYGDQKVYKIAIKLPILALGLGMGGLGNTGEEYLDICCHENLHVAMATKSWLGQHNN